MFFSYNTFKKCNKILFIPTDSPDSKETPGRGEKNNVLETEASLNRIFSVFFSHEASVGLYGLSVLQQMHNIISGRSGRVLYQNSNM